MGDIIEPLDTNQSSRCADNAEEASNCCGCSLGEVVLCKICQKVNLRELLFGSTNLGVRIEIGFLIELIQSTGCALCNLIVQALEQSWTALPFHSRKGVGMFAHFARTEVVLVSTQATTSHEPSRSIGIEVCCEGRRVTRGLCDTESVVEKYQAEIRLADDATRMGQGRIGHGRAITTICESKLLVEWYRICKASHDMDNCGKPRIISEVAFDILPGEQVPEARLPVDTHFVDVEEMNLVLIDDTCEFVALSYVWGTMVDGDLQTKMGNVERRHKHSGLHEIRFPKTIADAISVTRDLGLRYLWIDSLCITQDHEYKQMQIQNMDRIYGLASLVLVAAAGTDASLGLVGYRESPRPGVDQIIGTVQDLHLSVSLPPLQYVFENSKWNTRGWTFQEWHLARRALVFTNQQVYYVCSSSSFCEDVALEDVRPHLPMELIMDNCNASTIRHYLPSRYSRFTVNCGWVEYIQVVEAYSTREVSYESDKLRAISGLLSNLHRASRNRFLCGVSIGIFHDALFWIPMHKTKLWWSIGDNPDLLFPTWSWASAEGAIRYRIFPASDRSLIEEWEVWKDCQLGILGTPLTEPQNDRVLMGMTIFSDRPTAQDTEAETRRRGTGILGPNHIHQCFLKFKAEMTILQLAGGVINDFSSRAEALLDQRGAYMGVAILDKPRTQIEKIQGGFKDVKCIAISVSKTKMAFMDEPAFTALPEDDEWVNAMLVVELRNLLYARIGLGQVSRETWDDWANAESREINLA